MNWTASIKNAFKGMRYSVSRFPLTVLFLVLVAVLNGVVIENPERDFSRLIYTFLVGAFLSVVAQMIYERFFVQTSRRYALMAGAGLLTIAYYFAVGPQLEFNTVITIKTFVALFSLLIAFIWIPSINNEAVSFHRSFLSAVKAFFIALLFSLVLAGGITAIYGATNYLLFEIDANVLGHLLNIVGTLFAPIYFLSMTPLYPGEYERNYSNVEAEEQKERLRDQFTVPRFFELLISYIIIPLVGIYTLILVLYVVMNITGDFWTDNLLEPLLVSYAIIVLIVLILSYNLENKFAVFFRKVFPKILIPIVVFQTIASILKIREMGLTHGRYYVIMFGVFATIAGLIFSFMKPKYHGYIAAVLLILAAISIVPPVDAFTVSRRNQINVLEEKLVENDMLMNGQIVPTPNVPEDDRITITRSATYLYEMGYSEDVAYLPENFNAYNNFSETFGFDPTYPEIGGQQVINEFAYLDNETEFAIDISNFDHMVGVSIYYNDAEEAEAFNSVPFEVDGMTYQVEGELMDNYYTVIVSDDAGTELIRFDTQAFYDELFTEEAATEFMDQQLTVEEATFTTENEQAQLTSLVKSLERAPDYHFVEFNLFIDIKQ